MHKITSRVAAVTALGAAVVLAFAGAFVAVRKSKMPTADGAVAATTMAKQSAAGTGAGLVAFIDPVTGQLREPDPAELAALRATAPAPSGLSTRSSPLVAPAEMIYPAGGGVGMRVDASFDSSVVVTKGPDGKLKMDCVVGDAAANAIVNQNTNLGRTNNLNEK
jgi:hypothetical protein